uniref:Uncharacterized protein n=1 Tax=Timema poppense TaxID=170557 RepID=A0A7R9H5L4_TIMPO|nr:unnamed protein product [Timema poppensis]
MEEVWVGHTIPNLDDLGLAFQDLGINIQDLEEYIKNVESVPCVFDIPKYPIPRESHLNFLKPGSREVVTRPVHVHEHLPPMHPEMEVLHFTCAVHELHWVSEEICSQYSVVNNLISAGNKVFVNAPSLVALFKEELSEAPQSLNGTPG